MTGARELRIALCQMKVAADKESNHAKAALFIERARESGSEIVVLPEMWGCPYDKSYFRDFAEEQGGSGYTFLQQQSRGILLIGGSLPELEGDRIYNTCYVFEDGRLLGKYRKIHLFDVSYDGFRYKESDTISPGQELLVVKSRSGDIAIALCFDLRFPELFRELEERNPFLYVLPAAFNKISGPVHYRILGQVRALDQESYVALCSPASDPEGPYDPYGHSMVIDPWGLVLNELDGCEGIALQTINLDRVNEIRGKLPLKKQFID